MTDRKTAMRQGMAPQPGDRLQGVGFAPVTESHSQTEGPPGRREGRSSPPKDGKGKPAPGAAPPSRGLFGMVAILLLSLLLFMFFNAANQARSISLADFEVLWTEGKIDADSVVIKDTAVIAKQKADPGPPEKKAEFVRISMSTRGKDYVGAKVMEITGNRAKQAPSSPLMIVLLTIGPFLLVLFLLWLLVSRGLRSASMGGGMLGNFGKSRHRMLSKEMTGVTFDDVAGIEEAKDEVREIIEFLRNPKKFARLGGRIPRGVLLTGEPGCGKTLLAKAIAGEADVPFFTISGSDFVEMFVGVGASRVRDLFKQAKENAPCIIFLDEIDAVGRRRGSGYVTGGHDEREQTLNAILVEMDGFTPADGVIVIAATNRPDVLDPALIRPGRFDRQINVPLPDVKGRLEILRVHAKKVKLGPNVELERVARGTPMFSGADLAAIINEAAIIATMAEKDFVEQEDLEEARDKVKFGRAQKSRRLDKEENRATAYHEAGHAVMQALLPAADPLHKVTIIPRGQALGATFSLPEKDRMGFGLRWLQATMRVLCGGRIAEERATGDVSSGAAMDISQVTRLARAMILEWGMSPRLGFVRYAPADTREMFIPERDYSDDTAQLIDAEVRRLVDEAYADAARMIDQNWDKVESVAGALVKHETLTADEVHRLMRGERLDKPTVSELLAEESRKGRETPAGKASTSSSAGPDVPPGALPHPA